MGTDSFVLSPADPPFLVGLTAAAQMQLRTAVRSHRQEESNCGNTAPPAAAAAAAFLNVATIVAGGATASPAVAAVAGAERGSLCVVWDDDRGTPRHAAASEQHDRQSRLWVVFQWSRLLRSRAIERWRHSLQRQHVLGPEQVYYYRALGVWAHSDSDDSI